MTKIVYHVHTKNRVIKTTDLNLVNACIASGTVPFLDMHKDGYLRRVYRQLTHIEFYVWDTEANTHSELMPFYRASR